MSPRTPRLSLHSLGLWPLALITGFAGSAARADALYTIADLGTLSGQSSSVATSINNQGQVVGISYNSSDGSFAESVGGSAQPPRFTQTGNGAESFLFSNGQMSQINPTNGLAMSINSSGQVAAFTSINNLGQYVGGGYSGIANQNGNTPAEVVIGGTATVLQFTPYAINDAGQIVGGLVINEHGGADSHPVVFQNGQMTDLFSKVASGQFYDSRAIAVNQNGDILINVQPMGGSEQSYLYHANSGVVTNLTSSPGGSSMIAAALNIHDQVVGNGLLFSNGTVQPLLSLLPAGAGWSNLNATGINDNGQIVGQGTYEGQQMAFLMSPDAVEVPEPGTLALWSLVSAAAVVRAATRRTRKKS
jgi:probable HAF family extracellular repeat protein